MGTFKKIFFDSHYKIERFGVVFSVLIFILLSFNIYGLAHNYKKTKGEIGDKANYIPEIKFTKSEATGSIVDVYRSFDKKTGFILFKLNDTSNISLNANNYKVLLRGALVKGNDKALDPSIKGSVYMFGTSGYGGIYLVNSNGFKNNQIIDGVLRNGTKFTDSSVNGNIDADNVDLQQQQAAEDKKKDDPSAVDFDQARFAVNIGANKAIPSKILGDKSATPEQLYREFVATSEDKRMKIVLDNDLKAMKLSLNKIDEFRHRLATITFDNSSIVLPDYPEAMKGDKIVENEKSGVINYTTNYVYPGGFNFDYQKNNIESGYLKNIVPAGEDYTEYLTKVLTTTSTKPSTTSYDAEDYVFSNGKKLSDYTNYENDSVFKNIVDTINNLNAEYDKYLDLKYKYQTKDLRELLNIERIVGSIEGFNSIHTDAVQIFN